MQLGQVLVRLSDRQEFNHYKKSYRISAKAEEAWAARRNAKIIELLLKEKELSSEQMNTAV